MQAESNMVKLVEPRYRVIAQAKDYPHRGIVYKNVEWELFKCDDDKDEDYTYEKAAVNEMFTLEEAESLVGWLTQTFREFVTCEVKRVLELPEQVYPTSAIAVGGPSEFYMLDHRDDWSLPFKAWAYYNVEHAEASGVVETEEKRGVDKTMKLAIKYNNYTGNDPCAICEERTDPEVGPEIFLDGTMSLVCDTCTEVRQPELLKWRDAIRASIPTGDEQGAG